MKFLSLGIILLLIGSCSPASDVSMSDDEAGQVTQSADSTGSFRVRNAEIREEIIQMIKDAEIEHWIAEDGTINYNIIDGEAIDKIGNEVISEYITRN